MCDLSGQIFKYYAPETAISALKHSTICYSSADSFNDPFELKSGFSFESRNCPEVFWRKLGLIENSRILCLTRSWDNPLMWSHYAASYSGVVVGYDVDSNQLNDRSIIPLRLGSVVYTRTLPINRFPESTLQDLFDGSLRCYDSHYAVALQRLYLHKASCWSYEEEVRVVKHIEEIVDGKRINDGDGILEGMPPENVRSVIFGLNFRLGHSRMKDLTFSWANELGARYKNAKFYRINMADKEYALRLEKIEGSLTDYFPGVSNDKDWSGWYEE